MAGFRTTAALMMPTSSGHTRAIAASKVQGTNVFNTAGKNIGHVEDKVMFAVPAFGGFLGIGEKCHAMPWAILDYEPKQGRYVVRLSRQQLEQAPAYALEDLIANDGAGASPSMDYYSTLPKY